MEDSEVNSAAHVPGLTEPRGHEVVQVSCGEKIPTAAIQSHVSMQLSLWNIRMGIPVNLRAQSARHDRSERSARNDEALGTL